MDLGKEKQKCSRAQLVLQKLKTLLVLYDFHTFHCILNKFQLKPNVLFIVVCVFVMKLVFLWAFYFIFWKKLKLDWGKFWNWGNKLGILREYSPILGTKFGNIPQYWGKNMNITGIFPNNFGLNLSPTYLQLIFLT